ncbi:pollen-specific leucine-rich repeat extensin-like protein 3 [Penaeus chinensis]|uniref:pollen-specific leucine-rich repeat extensin-like protein 3 n=1 Tax=Penaeus chinensis TaxID=139456 RepID=UPI001FB7BCC1|nr:pollen-specific leucine-rich repeat extensin-like protein 3 [Penaeus chinensis]
MFPRTLVVVLAFGLLVAAEAKPAPSPQILPYGVSSPGLPGHGLPLTSPVVSPMSPGSPCSAMTSMCHNPISPSMMFQPQTAVLAPHSPMLPIHSPMALPQPPIMPVHPSMVLPQSPMLPMHPSVLPHPPLLTSPMIPPLFSGHSPMMPMLG